MNQAKQNGFKMQRKKILIPYFIFLLPVFFIINGYNDYFGFMPVKFIVWNLMWLSGMVFFVYFIGRLLFRENVKSILFSFFVSVFLIFFGSFFDTWKSFVSIHFFSSYYFVLPSSVFLIWLFLYFLKRSKNNFQRLFSFLNLLFFVLFFFEISRSLINTINTEPDNLLIDSRFNVLKSVNQSNTVPDTAKPDIFLLVFDGMPSTRALNEDLHFSNTNLDTFLLQNGFYVATEAKSNYDLTVLSVSSMLNMDYVSEKEIKKGTGIEMYFRATSSVLDNSLTRILKNEKYAIRQFQPLSIFNNKDWQGNLVFGNMLDMNYFYKTFPGRLYRDIAWNYMRMKLFKKIAGYTYMKQAREKRDDIELSAQLVKSVCSKNDSSKFVYAHFMLPHIPFVFNQDGGIRPFISYDSESSGKRTESAFVDQLKFANQKITELVKYIKANNKENTIIIVQGDHGYKDFHQSKNAEFVFQNLNAIYFPDKNYECLYKNLSPVNSFRIILNKYFGAQLNLLKDSSVVIEFSKNDWEK